ncbi:MAG: SDR family oxidoreductase [Gammaproteobacteria bacterium]|nr:SDR family oxidoreductase [Gammaproteobacteria bacterium]
MSLKQADLFNVEGKVAIITGGSRGIGKMIAQGFVENGARVYITSRKADQCNATAEELTALGHCVAIPADLSTNEGRASFISKFLDAEDHLDVLVNNAGAAWGAPFDQFPEAGYDKVMDINVKAVFMLTQALLPQLEKAADPANPARVINIGSIDALKVSMQDNYSYGASKAAVHWMTKNFALRLGRRGITFNAIAPGPFESKMMERTLDNFRDQIEAGNPMGRIGRPGDMAGIALFLASDAGSYVNGQVIAVDGGANLGSVIG